MKNKKSTIEDVENYLILCASELVGLTFMEDSEPTDLEF